MSQTNDIFREFWFILVFWYLHNLKKRLEIIQTFSCFEKWTDPTLKNSTCMHLMLNLFIYMNLISGLSISESTQFRYLSD